jgi:hypothetical protein
MKSPAVLAILVLLLAGCGADDENPQSADRALEVEASSEPSTEPTTAATTSASMDAGPTGDGVPDSSWTKELTAAQGRDAGMSKLDLGYHFGSDGRFPLTLRFLDETWSITVTNDSGIDEVGDVGTIVYDDKGRLEMTSESEGCSGCVATLGWRITGDVLTLKPVELPTDDPLERLIMSGTWERSQ